MGTFGNERGEQDSLAPVQLEVSIDRELAGMKRGRGAQLFAIAVVTLGTISGGVFAMRRLDRERNFEQTSAAVQQLVHTYITPFEQCALPLAQASAFESSERLYAAFADMIERSASNYARVLQLCEPKLAGLPPSLAAIRPPSELAREWAQLQSAAAALHDSEIALRSALEDPNQREDYVAVTACADNLAKMIFAYQERDAALQHALDTRR
jgi:hypothetical protein